MKALHRNRIRLLVVSFFLLLIVGGHSSGCLGYLWQAGNGQLEILCLRRPIIDVIGDPETEPQIKTKLKLVEEVRRFARSKVLLEVGLTYQQVSMLNRESLAFNVTASKPLKFEAKTWWFPIVGSLPYLGFFEKSDADALAQELRTEGWETLISEVGGYSTLGWFEDPLLSTQLHYSDWFLAELVIHECSHATIWFPDDVTFNESFANFVGKQGARQFFIQKYGSEHSLIKKHDIYLTESRQLNKILRRYTENLDRIYTSNHSDSVKKANKKAILMELRVELREKAIKFKILNLNKIAEKDLNNAFFLSFKRYKSGSNYFAKEFHTCRQDWKCFLKKMEKLRIIDKSTRAQLLKN